MNDKVDMHLHTYYSDGTLSPTEIVQRARKLGYAKIAITDHDTVNGVAEGVAAGEKLGVTVIPGIELSADAGNGVSVHMLGYRIDVKDMQLQKALAQVLANRVNRNERLLCVLRDMGIDIGYEDLDIRPECGYVGKPLIARALVKRGYIKTPKQAFEAGKFLESPEAKAVKKEKLSVGRAIELIDGAGGIAVLAHPMRIKKIGVRGSGEFYQKVEALVVELKDKGLKGLECYHSDHTQKEALHLAELAEKYRLYITQGSDYHGPEYERKK